MSRREDEVDVIIVAGAKLAKNGTASLALVRRTEKAIALYRAGRAKTLLLCGGGPRRHSEAEIMAKIALAAA